MNERLVQTKLLRLSAARYTQEDLDDGSSVDVPLLYENIQGKLRRSVRPKVLIVMKSRFRAGAFAQVLINLGCEVIVCTNGHKAYTSYLHKQSSEFSLCLCEWYLPGIAGRDLAYYEADSGGRLPFVAVLTTGQRGADAIRSGADLFFKQPLLVHLATIVELIFPKSTMGTNIQIGTVASNHEFVRRLLNPVDGFSTHQHTLDTQALGDLVRDDIAAVTEFTTMEAGLQMLEAIINSLKHVPKDPQLKTGRIMSQLEAALLQQQQQHDDDHDEGDDKLVRMTFGGEDGAPANPTTQVDIGSKRLRRKEMKGEAYQGLAKSFRNAMLVMNKLRTTLVASQLENHELRESTRRNAEQLDLLKTHLRSFGQAITGDNTFKLEKLFIPRLLTQSPERLIEDDSNPEPLHEQLQHQLCDVDATSFTRLELFRALKMAKAALLSSRDEMLDLKEELRRLQDYQIQVEDDLVGCNGLQVHIHLGKEELEHNFRNEVSAPSRATSSIGNTATTPRAGQHAALDAENETKTPSLPRSASSKALSDSMRSSFEASKRVAVMGPRMQQFYVQQQTGGGGNATNESNTVSMERALGRHMKRRDLQDRQALDKLCRWLAFANKGFEQQLMAMEDGRSTQAARTKPIAPVPRCAEKPVDEPATAVDTLLNGIIHLHNTLATEVNQFTAKSSVMFPVTAPHLQQLATAVRTALLGFNAGQQITAVQMHVEKITTTCVMEERALLSNERMEFEKYRIANPPNTRKLVMDMRMQQHDVKRRRIAEFFIHCDLHTRHRVLRKWMLYAREQLDRKVMERQAKQISALQLTSSPGEKRQAELLAKAKQQTADAETAVANMKLEMQQLQNRYSRVSSLFDEVQAKATQQKDLIRVLEDTNDKLKTQLANAQDRLASKQDELNALTSNLDVLERDHQELRKNNSVLTNRYQTATNLAASRVGHPHHATAMTDNKSTQTAISAALKKQGNALEASIIMGLNSPAMVASGGSDVTYNSKGKGSPRRPSLDEDAILEPQLLGGWEEAEQHQQQESRGVDKPDRTPNSKPKSSNSKNSSSFRRRSSGNSPEAAPIGRGGGGGSRPDVSPRDPKLNIGASVQSRHTPKPLSVEEPRSVSQPHQQQQPDVTLDSFRSPETNTLNRIAAAVVPSLHSSSPAAAAPASEVGGAPPASRSQRSSSVVSVPGPSVRNNSFSSRRGSVVVALLPTPEDAAGTDSHGSISDASGPSVTASLPSTFNQESAGPPLSSGTAPPSRHQQQDGGGGGRCSSPAHDDLFKGAVSGSFETRPDNEPEENRPEPNGAPLPVFHQQPSAHSTVGSRLPRASLVQGSSHHPQHAAVSPTTDSSLRSNAPEVTDRATSACDLRIVPNSAVVACQTALTTSLQGRTAAGLSPRGSSTQLQFTAFPPVVVKETHDAACQTTSEAPQSMKAERKPSFQNISPRGARIGSTVSPGKAVLELPNAPPPPPLARSSSHTLGAGGGGESLLPGGSAAAPELSSKLADGSKGPSFTAPGGGPPTLLDVVLTSGGQPTAGLQRVPEESLRPHRANSLRQALSSTRHSTAAAAESQQQQSNNKNGFHYPGSEVLDEEEEVVPVVGYTPQHPPLNPNGGARSGRSSLRYDSTSKSESSNNYNNNVNSNSPKQAPHSHLSPPRRQMVESLDTLRSMVDKLSSLLRLGAPSAAGSGGGPPPPLLPPPPPGGLSVGTGESLAALRQQQQQQPSPLHGGPAELVEMKLNNGTVLQVMPTAPSIPHIHEDDSIAVQATAMVVVSDEQHKTLQLQDALQQLLDRLQQQQQQVRHRSTTETTSSTVPSLPAIPGATHTYSHANAMMSSSSHAPPRGSDLYQPTPPRHRHMDALAAPSTTAMGGGGGGAAQHSVVAKQQAIKEKRARQINLATMLQREMLRGGGGEGGVLPPIGGLLKEI